jgi:hypothetical protein
VEGLVVVEEGSCEGLMAGVVCYECGEGDEAVAEGGGGCACLEEGGEESWEDGCKGVDFGHFG